jgi:low affinity Fe/Cu permease
MTDSGSDGDALPAAGGRTDGRHDAPDDGSSDRRLRMHALFDRVAERSSEMASRAPFFIFCLVTVAVWLPSFPVFGDVERWQLPINTFTTVVTFLLVALLQNAQHRTDRALHHKLDAIADGLADLMHYSTDADGHDVERDIRELRQAVGIDMEPSHQDHERRGSAAKGEACH